MNNIDLITVEDFKEYGTMDVEEAELKKLITKASLDIHRITKNRISNINDFPEISQTSIKLAVIAQVEYLEVHAEEIGTRIGGVRIGSYSETGAGANSSEIVKSIAPSALEYLIPTGLLYAGVRTIGGRWFQVD